MKNELFKLKSLIAVKELKQSLINLALHPELEWKNTWITLRLYSLKNRLTKLQKKNIIL